MEIKQLTLQDGQSVGAQVYQFMRNQIIHAVIPPGTRLSEADISKRYSVSRQPVREAFIKLRNEGLVVIRPQRGTFVTKISIEAVNDARFVREAIEADIVKLLAQEITDEQIVLLEQLLDEQLALKASDADEFMDHDESFHRYLAQCAGKTAAWQIIANMKAHFDRVRHLSSTQKPMQRLIDQHAVVVDAIKAGDAAAAEAAMRFHLHEVLRDLPKVVASQPDMFEDRD